MTSDKPRLEDSIRVHFAPSLRADGFRGSGRTFRRIVDEAVHVVNVQGFWFGGRFAVNLGVHPLRLVDVAGKMRAPSKITESFCAFRTRLGDSLTWHHDGTSDEMDRAVVDTAAFYRTHAHDFFGLFMGPDSVLQTLTVDSLQAGTYQFEQYCMGSVIGVAYEFAKLRREQGRLSEAKAFASFALITSTPKFVGHVELQEIATSA